MIPWRPIAELPDELKDGREVLVKRVYEGRVVKEGLAVFASLIDGAPMRQWGDGGLSGPIPPDHKAADERRWCNPGMLHRFPEPTHYAEITPP